MGILVACFDVENKIGEDYLGEDLYIIGWDKIESLVTSIGLLDPESSRVNCLLEGLKVYKDIEESGEEVEIAIISGRMETMITERSISRQIDRVINKIRPDSMVIVTSSIEEEKIIPIIESRIKVDAVDRVVVRQIHDLEDKYYLVKRFLSDEKLRSTILVPIGIVLTATPIMSYLLDLRTTIAAMTAIIGIFSLYKGLKIDEYVDILPSEIQNMLYSGKISVVTYVVAGGLILIGVLAGVIRPSIDTSMGGIGYLFLSFIYDSILWLTLAGLMVVLGKIADEIVLNGKIKEAHANLLFVVLSTAMVIRGFSDYFLQKNGMIGAMNISSIDTILSENVTYILSPGQSLTLFVVAGVLVSIFGIQITSRLKNMQVWLE